MSKHKNFHSTKNILKALQHGRRNAIGPYYSWKPKRYGPVQDKKELPGATNTEQLKADKTVDNPVESASSVPEKKEESQA